MVVCPAITASRVSRCAIEVRYYSLMTRLLT